ncbi:MAG: hypothetical protein HUJ51_04945 [Eggerthellaceae bacterium]|nr:hypothetical protein [Eggerthellaceae bacterium]
MAHFRLNALQVCGRLYYCRKISEVLCLLGLPQQSRTPNITLGEIDWFKAGAHIFGDIRMILFNASTNHAVGH